ncbi:MAG: alpha-amylase family glycosyl hydrolase [Flavisolibacter sp.]
MMKAQKEWIGSTNIYEVNLRQYTAEGNFEAFATHLPRLKAMGIETLWFMPITPISQIEKKGSMGSYYACSDYTSVNPEFGTLEDFKQLVATAHEMDFRVIIDWVANHTGWDHVWRKAHPDWYEKDPATGNFKKASGMDDIIELDFTNQDMRKAMTEAMKFWVRETGIDGFRCDLAFWVEEDYWLEAIPKVNQLKPLFWLAEMDPLEHPGYMRVFDAAYSWKWMHKTEDWHKQNLPLYELIKVLEQYRGVTGYQAWFTSNHDENSWNGTEYEKYGAASLPLAVHSLTWPGIPLIYNGQEIPLQKRLEFFEKDAIYWPDQPVLENFYQRLLLLRKYHPALHAGADVYFLPVSAKDQVLAYKRKSANDEVMVFLNLSPEPVHFELQAQWIDGRFKEIFTGQEMVMHTGLRMYIKQWAFQVYKKTG